jgi:hypothetical protein
MSRRTLMTPAAILDQIESVIGNHPGDHSEAISEPEPTTGHMDAAERYEDACERQWEAFSA